MVDLVAVDSAEEVDAAVADEEDEVGSLPVDKHRKIYEELNVFEQKSFRATLPWSYRSERIRSHVACFRYGTICLN